MTTAVAEKTKIKETAISFGYFLPIREADGQGVDVVARTARVLIISEGLGNLRDRNYYTKDAVASCQKVFDGKQFYVDHPSKSDEENRPERSVRDLGGYFFDPQLGTVQDPETGETLAACFASLRFADSEPGRLALAQVKEGLEYQKRFPNSKDVYVGISINGGGVSHPGTIQNVPVNMVTEIKEAFSADIVTKPARGGKFLALTEQMKEAAEVAEFKQRIALGLRDDPTTVAQASAGTKGEKMAKDANMKAVEARRKEVAAEAKQAMLSGEGIGGIAPKIQRLVAAINEPPEDPKDLIADIQGDLDALSALLGDLGGVYKDNEAKRKAAGQAEKEEEKMKTGEGRKRSAESEDEAKRRASEKAKATETEDEAKKAAETEDEEESEKTTETEDEAKKTAETEDEEESEKTAETEDEGEEESEQAYEEPSGKRPRALMGEDEDEAKIGMRADEDEDEDEDADAEKKGLGVGIDDMAAEPRAMKYQCEACEHENEVIPPKGFRLVQMDEQYATEAKKGLGKLVARLRRTLEAKEARFMVANKDKRDLMLENIKLRSTLQAYERVVEAKRALKEAGIPRDVLSPTRLIAFEKDQWPVLIGAAKRTLSLEADQINKGGGNGPKGSMKDTKDARGAEAAVSAFRESYTK